ncbi:hypothetical protein BV898_00976 [Hypsibius exemplaris]|uniref:Uncharacterized protein n=1 Tax=Hypsibius exemplaris TaxID=2072580 RepID=A0A1W0XCS6_HYPEX|nr:hypothetical protein BV898_00976 [Hypsibius exemplaris]
MAVSLRRPRRPRLLFRQLDPAEMLRRCGFLAFLCLLFVAWIAVKEFIRKPPQCKGLTKTCGNILRHFTFPDQLCAALKMNGHRIDRRRCKLNHAEDHNWHIICPTVHAAQHAVDIACPMMTRHCLPNDDQPPSGSNPLGAPAVGHPCAYPSGRTGHRDR